MRMMISSVSKMLVIVICMLVSSSTGHAQQSCLSSLDCHGDEVDGFPATLSGCCVPGGGLSYREGSQCSNCYSEESFTTEGNSFSIGFFGNFNPGSSSSINKVRFAVNSVTNQQVTVFVQSPLDDRKIETYSTPIEFGFSADKINLRSPEERDKGVYIYSKDGEPMSVIALAEEFQSSDAFKVLPCVHHPSDGYEYYAVSVPISQIQERQDDYEDDDYTPASEFLGIEGRSALVIVTTEDDTTLQITLTQNVDLFADDLKDQVPKGEIEAGQPVTINIARRIQTLYLGSDEDLSGSRVVSDKPISFFSGHECGTVPSNISYCDHMNEQIPPTATWGKQFITAPLANRRSGDTFKIVASRDNTNVQIGCTNDESMSISLDKGEMSQFVISSDSSCYFMSSQPILLVQFSMSSTLDGVFLSDPFMIVVPPVEQYRSRYNTHSFRSSVGTKDQIGSYFLNILFPVNTLPSGIRLNDMEVSSSEITAIPCADSEEICAYSILVEGVSESPILRHVDNMRINAIVYWYEFRVGYGYFAGMTQRPIALPAVSLTSSMFTAFENNSSVNVTVMREGDLDSEIVVKLKTSQLVEDNVAIAGVDFVHTEENVTFARGVDQAQITIPLINDVFPEATESFQVFLSASPGVYIQSPAVATVMINDRDPDLPVMNVSFSAVSLNEMEGGVVRFTLDKTQGAVGDVSVRLFTIDDSAIAGRDYQSIDEVITFAIEELQYEGTLLIMNDEVVENVEQLSLQIEALDGVFPVNVMDAAVMVTITDDDVAVFSFLQATYSTNESDSVLQVSLEYGVLDRTVELQLISRSGSAIENIDYIGINQRVVFSPDGPSSVPIMIMIIPDGLVERDETFSIGLTTSQQDPASRNIVIGRDVAQITINDLDTAVIVLEDVRSVIREGGGSARFNIRLLSGELGIPVDLVYSTYNINATGGDSNLEDYVAALNEPVTLSSLSPIFEGLIVVNDDGVFEGEINERFGVQLSLLSGVPDRVTIETSTIEFQIEDNDSRQVARVGFSQSSFTTVEEAGTAALVVNSNGANPDPVIVGYTVDERNTQDGNDVTGTSGSLMLFPGVWSVPLTIELTQDTTPEPSELLNVTLTAGDDVSLEISTATVTILDTDAPNCGPLSSPSNGNVATPSGITVGNVASYSCDEGLVLTGSTARVCGNDRLWTPEAPTCEVPTCGQLSRPVNGALSLSSGVNEGSVATYTCDTGFTLTGSATRTCTSNGGWTPSAPVCLIECSALSSPSNGNVDTSFGTTAGNVALYSCDEGLVLTGSPARICDNNGLWTPNAPTCEETLPPSLPGNFQSVEIGTNNIELLWTQDEVVTGYILDITYNGPCVPNSQMMFLDSSLRSYTITGLEEGSSYNIELSALNGAGMSEGSRLQIFTVGTAPSGPPQSVRPTTIDTNLIILRWDGVDCLERNNLGLLRYFVEYSQLGGATSTIITSRQNVTIRNLEPGTMYTFQVAGENDAGRGPFASLSHSTLFEPTITTECPTVTECPTMIECPPPCCTTGDLRLVDGENELEGRVEICFNGQWGTVCDDSWGNNDATVVCRQVGHSDQGARAFQSAFFGQGDCPILLDDVSCNGNEERLESCGSRGYEVHNCGHHEDAGVRCLAAGTALQCPPLQPINGIISYSPDLTPDFDIGTVVTYSCNVGFVLDLTSGRSETRTCTASIDNTMAVWIGREPRCIASTGSCPPPPPIRNGMITYSVDTIPDFDIGTVAVYTCGLGNLSGVLTCIDEGFGPVWRGQVPSC
ncbi:uncharacterized protein LOC135336419 isoform X3 [Halichondria panicea]|uniref:uncharacterized protein LOC135336419 isoform X3 n=1 Tax=Halichondria panicea TaxID=6063 RepID=UPI00312B867A